MSHEGEIRVIRRLSEGIAYWSVGETEGIAVVPYEEGESIDEWAPGAQALSREQVGELARQVRRVLRR